MGKISITFCNPAKNYSSDVVEVDIPEDKNYKLFWPEVHNGRQAINRVYYMLGTDYWNKNKNQFEA